MRSHKSAKRHERQQKLEAAERPQDATIDDDVDDLDLTSDAANKEWQSRNDDLDEVNGSDQL